MSGKSLYILELVGDKFYVGLTSNIAKRLTEHKEGTCGSEWTKLYPPVRVFWIRPNSTEEDENAYTYKMMKYYGICNVRGGMYTKLEMSPSQIEFIRDLISSNTNSCYGCGSRTHFRKDCPRIGLDMCARCGREGHHVATCFARKDKLGNEIPDPSDEEDDWISVEDFDDKVLDTSDDEQNPRSFTKKNPTGLCRRCGRTTHTIENCKAERDCNRNLLGPKFNR